MSRLNYKIMFITSDVVMVEDVIRRVEDIINSKNGYVLNVKRSGNKRLTYAIKDVGRGNYICMEFMAEPKAIRGLNKVMDAANFILWHKFIRLKGLGFGCKSDYQCF